MKKFAFVKRPKIQLTKTGEGELKVQWDAGENISGYEVRIWKTKSTFKKTFSIEKGKKTKDGVFRSETRRKVIEL